MIWRLVRDTRGTVFAEYATLVGAVGLAAAVAIAWLAYQTDVFVRTSVGQAVGVGDQTVAPAPPPLLGD